MQEVEFLLAEEKKTRFLSKKSVDPFWIHHVVQIKENGYEIILEDDSTWSIGWYWRSRLSNWEESDDVVLSYHCSTYFPNYMKFHNRTKDSVVWGSLEAFPRASSLQSQYILKINCHFSEVTLSNGSRYKSSVDGAFRNYKEGDLIITCFVIDPPDSKMVSDMAIWNFYAGSISWDINPVGKPTLK
ncbi:putative uncharacterized protein [Waddlia chondrophila 2032/99]|uniref:Uncharacterized protein n=1 Tax=Waddlia chondrophila 2032/99 TaxID=765953 RepID=F8LFG0_9BACT|nr:putative uncharacterized protein [Waddlia chondrophila 2032/99]